MKLSALFAAVCIAMLSTSATAWPFWWHPHPYLPFPPHAPAPSSPHFPSLPPVADMTKCYQAVHDSSGAACLAISYDAGKCCSYLSGTGDACSYLPYYKGAFFQGLVKHVCDGGSAPSPTS